MAPEEGFDAAATSALDEGDPGTVIGRYHLLQRMLGHEGRSVMVGH